MSFDVAFSDLLSAAINAAHPQRSLLLLLGIVIITIAHGAYAAARLPARRSRMGRAAAITAVACITWIMLSLALSGGARSIVLGITDPLQVPGLKRALAWLLVYAFSVTAVALPARFVLARIRPDPRPAPGARDVPGVRGNRRVWAVGFTLATAAAAATFLLRGQGGPFELIENHRSDVDDLARMATNQWLLYHQPRWMKWRRQAHAGIAYDSNRGVFYVFGSDTHNQNWDNSIHEFDPQARRWTTHYPPAARETYRIDDNGIGVSGDPDAILPWAMHTFDNVVYDAINDALVVISKPNHNPIDRRLGESPRIYPPWVYHLPSRLWFLPEDLSQRLPGNFGGSSAYDTGRDTIVTYGAELAELGPDRAVWRYPELARKHHKIHHTMEYDSRRRQLMVFGDYGGSDAIGVYTPGVKAGDTGEWEMRKPGGAACLPDEHFPVAFDDRNGVFLMVTDNQRAGKLRDSDAGSSNTFVYDPERNVCVILPDAELPAQRMNYMMVYDSRRGVFFLVTGDWHDPPAVLALRLDLAGLDF